MESVVGVIFLIKYRIVGPPHLASSLFSTIRVKRRGRHATLRRSKT